MAGEVNVVKTVTGQQKRPGGITGRSGSASDSPSNLLAPTIKCSQVKYLGRIGALVMTKEQLVWMPSAKTGGANEATKIPLSFVVTHFSSKSPAIKWKVDTSENGKKKSYVFEFLSPTKTSDREKFRSAVVRHIDHRSVTGRKVRKGPVGEGEARRRAALLSGDREIRQMFKELVPKVMSEDEFWEGYSTEVLSNEATVAVQKVGMATAMLTRADPSAETLDTVRFRLTPSAVQQIFTEYPSVREAYKKQVPDSMSEIEFWKRYFKAKFYVKESRALPGGDDVFLQGLEEDEARLSAPVVSLSRDRKLDPMINVVANEADLVDTPSDREGGEDCAKALSVIRTCHTHGQHVLSEGSAIPALTECSDPLDVVRSLCYKQAPELQTATPRARNGDNGDAGRQREERIRKNIQFTDLEGKKSLDEVPLDLKRKRHEFEKSSLSSAQNNALPSFQHASQAQQQALRVSLGEWKGKKRKLNIGGNAFFDALNDVTTLSLQAGSKGQRGEGVGQERTGVKVNETVLREFTRTNETLRHFWGCVPPSTAERRTKMARIVNHLRKIEQEIKNWEAKANANSKKKEGTAWFAPMLENITIALKAYEKFRKS
eukprot:CAMPEP_0119156658 /NCGR_PEP_ID=MMETSP1310-20130426/52367_1 /TAXON_ID=464262 /ORGANISM="Genus nov. species nov., Strain RCC2339" /LENGTH=601 /DNA_ID=CAMNT_0007149273 /DNA_START=64 /DNA_END=1869 /DNA_ORIENTATION=-